MKPFRFGLEKVLALRALQAMKAQQALAEAQAAVLAAAAALEQVQAERNTFHLALAERRARGMPAWEWSRTSERLEAYREAERAAADALRQAQEAMAVRRTELQAAKQREETLNKLQERQREAHELAALAEEQVMLDELAQTMRLTRRRVDLS
ncbi:MAG TPA: flagellar export protein FliJ [Symbiobacteriaceae bacterium]|nr:flagellar export protein FliJ [Symbiobacteriaceae bacterium]